MRFASQFSICILLCLANAGAACGRTTTDEPKQATPQSGFAGAASGGGGNGGAGTASVQVETKAPLVSRHALLGTSAARGCFTSAVRTERGLMTAGLVGATPIVGAGSGDPANLWRHEPLTTAGGAALVFGAASGPILAWSDASAQQLRVRAFDRTGVAGIFLETAAFGNPIAGAGTAERFSLVLAWQKRLSLLRYAANVFETVALETEPCAVTSSIAIGELAGDTVVAYYCDDGAALGAPERAERLILYRIPAASFEPERSIAELSLFGTPAAQWLEKEFVVAHSTSAGKLVLSYATPGTPVVRSRLVSGLAAASSSRDAAQPVYSVAAAKDAIMLTRATCQRREDDAATGTVAVCRIATDSYQATCSEVDAPCSVAKLESTPSGVLLLPCGSAGSPALVELDAAALPAAQDGLFPGGFSRFEPAALSCEGEACSALLVVDSVKATTGYEQRLAFVDASLEAGCEVAACKVGAPELSSVFSSNSADIGSLTEVAVERQHAGLPLAVVAMVRAENQLVPQLSLLTRAGVAWKQTLPRGSEQIFAHGGGFRVFWSDFPQDALHDTSVTQQGSASQPDLPMRLGSAPPSMARCGDRLLIHALDRSRASSIAPPTPAIFALDPLTSQLTLLFDPGIAPAKSPEQAPSRFIGCAGEWLFMLDGNRVRRYSLGGERSSDIEVPSSLEAAASTDQQLTQFETRSNDVLALRANSGGDQLYALFLHANGSVHAYQLPLPANVVPLVRVRSAPDRGDGWLRVLYQSAAGPVHLSSWQLDP
jgi:hypothetical protein